MTSSPTLSSAASRIDTSQSSRICELQRPSKTAQAEPHEFKKLFKMVSLWPHQVTFDGY
jgi:hypothetical protein